MSYISGNRFDFERRLHQLADSVSDLNNFSVEGNSYYDDIDQHTINKWNREFKHSHYEITGQPNEDDYIAEGPWTPADIPDLSVFLHFSAGNCYESNGGASSTDGNPVGYVAPLFGTSITASEATNKPTFRANGLQLDTAGLKKLVLSSEILGNGEFTIYWSMLMTGANTINVLSHSTSMSFLGSGGSSVAIYDENTNGAEIPLDISNSPSLYLGRFDTDGLNGHYEMNATYGSSVSGSGAYGSFPFDQIGGLGNVGAATDSQDARIRLIILVNRRIEIDSPEDILIRNWIKENDGAELGTPEWTPANIANLQAYMQFIKGRCQEEVGVGADYGDSVGRVDGLYGTTVNADAVTNKPTLQADGLQLDASGVEGLNLSDSLSNSVGVTVYWSMILASGASTPILNSAGLSFVGGFGGEVATWDENANSLNLPNDSPGELVMGRYSLEAGTNAYSFISTAQSEIQGTYGGSPDYTLTKVGGTGGLVSNDNLDNRLRLIIWINRPIALNSAEDILIRNWIATFDGATL